MTETPKLAQLVGTQQDGQLAAQRAVHIDDRHAGDARKRLGQLVLRQAAELAWLCLLLDSGELQDGLGARVGPVDDGLADLGGQLVAHRGDGICAPRRRFSIMFFEKSKIRTMLVPAPHAKWIASGPRPRCSERLLDAVDDLALDGLGRRAG